MNRQFWIEQLFSMPGALVVCIVWFLISPSVERWREKYAHKTAHAKTERARRRYHAALYYATHDSELTRYMIVETTFVIRGAVIVVLGCFLLNESTAFHLANPPMTVHTALRFVYWVLGMSTLVFGTFQVTHTARGLFETWMDVTDFDQYLKCVPAEFRKPDIEALALKMRKISHEEIAKATSTSSSE